jgi:hypothetical protein
MFNFERIGDLNPQLLRELRSRLSWRNGLIAVAISAIGQLLLLLSQYSKLPENPQPTYPTNSYCMAVLDRKCTTDSLGNILINWPKWWAEVAIGASWLMFFGLFVGGVYLLASSFSQEEKRGTLNFIRLTPQKASTIFLGKLLGVPILVYLSTALALPLQFYAANQAHISRLHVLSWDIFMGAMASVFFLGAMLATMWFRAQSILLAAGAIFATSQVIFNSLHWHEDSYSRGGYEWYGLVLGNRLSYYLVFIGLAMVGVYWLYKALERRYLQPQATVFSKGQSYLWSLMFHLFLMGFYVDSSSHKALGINHRLSFHLPFNFGGDSSGTYLGNNILTVFGLVWLLLLVPLLLPSRQSLVEWSRHGTAKAHSLRSLIWHDKSPAVLAVAINVSIASMVWLTPIVLFTNRLYLTKILLGCFITIVLAAIYSSIAHWVLFWQVNNRPLWIAGIVGALLCSPVLGATVISFGISTSKNPLFLFSPFVWTSIKAVSTPITLLICGLLAMVLSWLVLRLQRVIAKVGRSESYQNFAA